MKDYNLDRILVPAVKLFMTYNYERVSTSLLEQATGLTRGAIFYKFRTKEEIFKAVVDRYILALQPENKPVGDSLIDFIDRYVDGIDMRLNKLIELDINDSKAYFSLIYQAMQYYPGFSEKITGIFSDNQKRWEEIVQVAKDSGEIKFSCDSKLAAQKFRYICSGLSFECSLLSGLDIAELRVLYYSIYNEIRNSHAVEAF